MRRRGHPTPPSRRHLPQANEWSTCVDCQKPCAFPSPCGRCQYCYTQYADALALESWRRAPDQGAEGS